MKKMFFYVLALWSLTACQQVERQAKVFGRYVPERKDDFAWENEYAAFRMYGPALAPENPSNGVDLWLKTSPELVVDSFYYREHVLGLPYHINYGKGLDCYKVAHTCGAGGLVVIADGQTWIGGPYDRWEILEQTPDKFVFKLEYDSVPVRDRVLQQSVTITAEAGQLLNKAEVVLTGDYPGDLCLGAGICLHDDAEGRNMRGGTEEGYIAYAEDALSDKTAAQMNFDYNGSTSQGRNYIAVKLPGGSADILKDQSAETMVIYRPYTLGDTLTYWFGACWSKWSNGEQAFPTDEDWFEAVKSL